MKRNQLPGATACFLSHYHIDKTRTFMKLFNEFLTRRVMSFSHPDRYCSETSELMDNKAKYERHLESKTILNNKYCWPLHCVDKLNVHTILSKLDLVVQRKTSAEVLNLFFPLKPVHVTDPESSVVNYTCRWAWAWLKDAAVAGIFPTVSVAGVLRRVLRLRFLFKLPQLQSPSA